jgi:hypothetical protein
MTQQVVTIWVWAGKPGSGPTIPFLFLISNTFRWLLEWISLLKVGLQAGLYSEKSRPDLYRTPHALHRVLAPKGPVLHCGVFWTWQWLHRRCKWASSWASAPVTWASAFFFCFFAGGSPETKGGGDGKNGRKSKGLRAQARGFGFLFFMVLVFLVILIFSDEKRRVFPWLVWFWGNALVWIWTGYRRDSSGRESSTKWETHSKPATSSSCKPNP